ncbi:MAG: hypothetical protein HY704_11495 [Gemmatimonadetes bacterium]|nr:hypothetical protein [Gemmatimonadota bacterium]
MFENLRRAFREAVANFRTELHRDEAPDTIDALLRGMRSELVDARAYLGRLREELARTTELAEAEGREAGTCRRRERLARDIQDAETAEVARQFAERHEQRRDVLRRKADAVREELVVRTGDLEEMEHKLRESQHLREDLLARSGRAGARESVGAADDLFEELDRMAEKILDQDRRTEAVDQLLNDLEGTPPPRPAELEIEERLAELKRRMGRTSD